ncbi:chemotaxis protein CheW [Geoalkalibacter subterraneus]|nr:chemotaxis protein CheW [Geoalkalibacter subterraneus]
MNEKFCLFHCGGIALTIPVGKVLRVEPGPRIYPLPRMRASMNGVFRFEKEWVPVLHFEKIIPKHDFRQDACCTERKYVLVCATELGYVGLPCDRAVRIVNAGVDCFAACEAPLIPGCSQEMIYRNERYPILDIDRLLPHCP